MQARHKKGGCMGKLTMTRRTFAKMTAATTAAVGIARHRHRAGRNR